VKNISFNPATFFIPLRTFLNVDLVIEHMGTGNQIFQSKHTVNILGETHKIFSRAYNTINESIYNLDKKSVQKIHTKRINLAKKVNKYMQVSLYHLHFP